MMNEPPAKHTNNLQTTSTREHCIIFDVVAGKVSVFYSAMMKTKIGDDQIKLIFVTMTTTTNNSHTFCRQKRNFHREFTQSSRCN